MKYIVVVYFVAIAGTFVSSSLNSARECTGSGLDMDRCAEITLEDDAINAVFWPAYWRDRHFQTLKVVE